MSKLFENELEDRIKYTLQNKDVEFEVIFKENNLDILLKLIKRLQSLKYKLTETEELDIFVKDSSLRVTLNKDQIIKLCKTNTIDEDNIIEIIDKQRIDKYRKGLINNDFDFKINLKREIDYKKKEHESKDKFFNHEIFKIEEKRYRQKKRYSFLSDDNNFKIDLSIVKQADGKDIINSGLVNKEEFYEIELEYVGKLTYNKENMSIFKSHLKKNIGYILQIIQDSFYIISQKEKEIVKECYNSLLKKIVNNRKRDIIENIKSLLKYIDEGMVSI